MKTTMTVPVVLTFLLIGSACCQAQEGPSSVAEAAQSAVHGSFFDQVGDWFATVGKTTEDKDRILEERQLQRVQSQASAQLATYRQAAQAGAQNAKTAVMNEIDAVKAKFREEVAKAEAASAAEIQAAKAKYDDLVAKSRTKAATKIEAAKARFNEEFAKLKAQATAQAVQMKEDVQAKARQKLEQAKDKVSAQAAAYQRQVATKAAKPVEQTKSRLGDLLK